MIKRAFDIVFSSIGLIVFAPVLLIVAALILLTSPGPVFYRGERTGLAGISFKIFKFRTMVEDAEVLGGSSTSDNDCRITWVGGFLRKYKIDELPQLFNVICGEMSFVGPRPEVKKYTDMYSSVEKNILNVRPGITDWASLANSDEGAILVGYDDPDKAYEEVIRPEKLRLQLKYVRERSFFKDLAIIWRTLVAVVSR